MNGNISQEGEKCPHYQNEHSKCFRQAKRQQRCPHGTTVSYTSRVYNAFFKELTEVPMWHLVYVLLKGAKTITSVPREVSEF